MGGAIEVEVLLGVDICDDLFIFVFFMGMFENGSSFELCSILNFIWGRRFWSRLCNSLMSPHGHFQNIKQVSLSHSLSLSLSIYIYIYIRKSLNKAYIVSS